MLSKSDYIDYIAGYEITWWGVDKNGYIFHCLSAGTTHVPKVIVDQNEAQSLAGEYFSGILEVSTKSTILFSPANFFFDFVSEYEILLATKGIFCFDAVLNYCDPQGHEVFEKYPYWYKKLAAPVEPIHIDSLDKRVQILMSYFRFDVDVKNNDYIFFKSLLDVL